MKKSNLKEYLKKFKELWAIPKYRALIKLLLYGVMFLILIIMSNVYQDTNYNKNKETEQTKTYTEIINSIDLENCDIEYIIKKLSNEYKIEGQIKNNILIGYLENDNIIKKVKVIDGTMYQISNNEETIDIELNSAFSSSLLIPKKIIEIINDESAYIEKEKTSTSYTYNIIYNNIQYEIKLITDLKTLTNITINNTEIEYNMNLNFDTLK